MHYRKVDRVFLFLILGIIIGLPVAIFAYDDYRVESRTPPGSKFFTLTGSVEHGWTAGGLPAWKVLAHDLADTKAEQAVIEVEQGDGVVLELTSNDVIHGFSLKDFGVFVNEGIEPGKPVVVSFIADKAGEFTFACNAICGDNHESMQGVLRVKRS